MNTANLKPFLIGLGILGIGVIGLVALVALRPEPPKVEPPRQSPLVTTTKPTLAQGNLAVRGNGTVRPIREISLVAEVAGKVTSVSDALVSGGFFQQGQTLLQIDPTDYENAVAVAEAEVTQRQFELLTAQEEVTLAREEWARLERRTGVNRQPDTTALGSLALVGGALMPLLRLQSAQAAKMPSVAVDGPMIEFALPGEDGASFESKSLAGKPYLLKFFRGHW